MQRRFARIGSLVFALAVVWYCAGNYFIESLHKQSQELAKSRHKSVQHFDLGANAGVIIRTESENSGYGAIKLVLDPGVSTVVVNNANFGLTAKGQLADGVLNITLDSLRKRHYNSFDNLSIRLPSSVKKIGIAKISAVELSSAMSGPAAELQVEILDCTSRVNVKRLQADRLGLATACKQPSEKRCCRASFDIGEEVAIGDLVVSLPRGKLEFTSNVVPQKVQLKLGDAAEITSGRAFLQNAQISKLP